MNSMVNMWDPIDVERAKVWVEAGNPTCPICGQTLFLHPATREADALDGMIRLVGDCPCCRRTELPFFVEQE